VNVRIPEVALWTGAVIALAVAATESRGIVRHATVPAPLVWSAPPPNATPSSDSLAVLARRIVDDDAFRLDRKPAAVPYVLAGDSSASVAPLPPPVPKPMLTLVGIVGGPPWAALINGIPGHDGTVLVHPRDTVGGLRIRDVSAAAALITGLDTVWHLSTKHD